MKNFKEKIVVEVHFSGKQYNVKVFREDEMTSAFEEVLRKMNELEAKYCKQSDL